MLIVLESGSLNLLEPSGPVQACNGIALPLLQIFTYKDLSRPSRGWEDIIKVCLKEVGGHNTSDHTMTLGLTQPLTEMCTRNISWRVKAAGA